MFIAWSPWRPEQLLLQLFADLCCLLMELSKILPVLALKSLGHGMATVEDVEDVVEDDDIVDDDVVVVAVRK